MDASNKKELMKKVVSTLKETTLGEDSLSIEELENSEGGRICVFCSPGCEPGCQGSCSSSNLYG